MDRRLPKAVTTNPKQEFLPSVDLPPPVDPTADLRHLPWMKWPLDVTMASEAWVAASPSEHAARINLFAAAWKSMPAGSLPSDEKTLKALSKSGRQWPKVRDFALDGFKIYRDNRCYHPVLASLAQESWRRVLSNRTRQKAFRGRRTNRYVTVTEGVTQRDRDNEIRENQKKSEEWQLPPAEPWDARTRGFAEDLAKGKKPFWRTTQWGPAPNSPGTLVPREVLRRYGFVQTLDENNRSA